MKKRIRILWRNIKILMEWFIVETINDFKKLKNKEIYKRKIKKIPLIYKDIGRIFISPTYIVYWYMFLPFLALIKTGASIWFFISIILYIIVYGWKLWVSGEPPRFYKETYFSSENDQNRNI